MFKVPVINKSNNDLPKYATSGSAGFDFCADVTEVKEKLTWNCSLSRNTNGLQQSNIAYLSVIKGSVLPPQECPNI